MSQPSPSDNTQQPKVFTKQVSRTLRLDYLLFLPKGCSAKSEQQWPLMLFLHGAGERGTNVWAVATHGPPKIVRSQPDFPFIVVSPQCPSGTTWSNDTLLALLDEIIAQYPVDTTRVYLTGLSMGGYGTWSLGLEHAERFAAIVPICGGGDPIRIRLADTKRTAVAKALGIWAFHGGKDNVVPLSESERMVTTLKGLGCTDIQLTVYPNAGHDSWSEAYANPKLYEWLLAHKRPKS
jgi:predicted peptidase